MRPTAAVGMAMAAMRAEEDRHIEEALEKAYGAKYARFVNADIKYGLAAWELHVALYCVLCMYCGRA